MSIDSTPATKAQIEYIKVLQRKMGIKGGINNMDSLEASKLIGDLISALDSEHNMKVKINKPRLGMAMAECFRLWKNNGWDIYKKHRKAFITDAVDTYWLFSEIAEKLEADVK